jgi:hypothetical protein
MIPQVNVPEGKKGPWTVSKFTVEKNGLTNLRLWRDGRGCLPGTYTRLSHERRGIIMSDTTAEQNDHRPFIYMARGRCLINGLGIGMCLGAALAKPQVEFVTVIELDQDVIDLVWPTYQGQRCEIIHSSAFDFKPPKTVRYGAVWHDIWDTICEDNIPEMIRLHRKFGRFADWQGSWGRAWIERERRQNRRNRYW